MEGYQNESYGNRVRECDSGYGPVAGSCKYGKEPSGPTKGGEFFDQLGH